MAYVLDQAALNRRAGHKPDAMLTPNVVTGRMARGYVLSENAGDGCWWLTSPSGHDRRVPAIVAEQLVNEGMVEIADKVRNMVSTTYRLTNRGGM